MEYWAYIPDKVWYIKEIIKAVGVCIVSAWILYDNLLITPILFPVGIYIFRKDRNEYERRRRRQLREEFKELIILLSGKLNAGCSLEQAVRRANDDMAREDDFEIVNRETAIIINGLNLNREIESLLVDMGMRCQEDSIKELAGLMATAKKYGGNINTLIDKTKKKLNQRVMLEKEIETMVAAKRLEGMVMLLMPFAMMLYMRFTNYEYISQMYKTLLGNVVITIALLVVMVCGIAIDKITKIEV